MEKTRLNRFVQKYNLNGNAEQVKWSFKQNKLTTDFITEDKSLKGIVVMNNIPFQDMELGVYDTAQLQKLLSVLDEDITLNVNEIGDTAVSMNIKNGSVSVDYNLSALSIIPTSKELKTIPDFGTQIKIDGKFIETFIKGKTALPDATTFSILNKRDKNMVVVGYATTNTNRVNIPVETFIWDIEEPITFNADLFKEILVANKECKSAILEVSTAGLAKINFKVDDYDSTYYIVATKGVN